MEEKITYENIQKYIGKILLKENADFKWMFKVVGIKNQGYMLATNAIDIYPEPRFYSKYVLSTVEENLNNFFYTTFDELIEQRTATLRTPTKEELLQYINYTREMRLLNKESFLNGQLILKLKYKIQPCK